MIAERILHAIIFGRHFHSCPSELCHGKEQPCSDPYDCQRGPKLCGDCNYIQNEERFDDIPVQTISWAEIERMRWNY
jgi:hypothetical protein